MVYFGKLKDSNEYNFSSAIELLDSYVEIEDKDYQSYMAQKVKEKKIFKADEKGYPILVKPTKSEANKIKSAVENRKRIIELEQYLVSTDWYVLRFIDSGASIPEEVKQKRQEARDEISRLRDN